MVRGRPRRQGKKGRQAAICDTLAIHTTAVHCMRLLYDGRQARMSRSGRTIRARDLYVPEGKEPAKVNTGKGKVWPHCSHRT